MRCDCKHCWMNSITQIILKASTLSAFKTSCCQSTLTWKCQIFIATVHVMFHYERALPRTNTFVNNQTTLSLQVQTNEVWELMHHNGILVALQHIQPSFLQISAIVPHYYFNRNQKQQGPKTYQSSCIAFTTKIANIAEEVWLQSTPAKLKVAVNICR